MSYQISFHYDGNIIKDHKITARTLGKTLQHLQRALDRAFLEEKYGAVEKNTRLKGGDYEAADFIALDPREGGYILDLIKDNDTGKKICNKLISSLDRAYEDVINEENSEAPDEYQERKIVDQVETKRAQVLRSQVEPYDFLDLEAAKQQFILRTYAERLICREIDQVLSIIRAKKSGESTFELTVDGTQSKVYEFDRERSKRFHKVVSKRRLGPETLYKGYVREMDADQQTGRFYNADTDRKHTIYFSSLDAFYEARDSLGDDDSLHLFYGCPYIEYDAYDLKAGDVYYLTVKNNDE